MCINARPERPQWENVQISARLRASSRLNCSTGSEAYGLPTYIILQNLQTTHKNMQILSKHMVGGSKSWTCAVDEFLSMIGTKGNRTVSLLSSDPLAFLYSDVEGLPFVA